MSGERAPRFQRRCSKHGDCEVLQVGWKSLFLCTSGHNVFGWDIFDSLTGKVVGHADYLKGGQLFAGQLDEALAVEADPIRICKRGHQVDRFEHRCRVCQLANQAKYKRAQARRATV